MIFLPTQRTIFIELVEQLVLVVLENLSPLSLSTFLKCLKEKPCSFMSRYDVELVQRIEAVIDKKMELYPNLEKDDVLILQERVSEACRMAELELKDSKHNKGSKRGRMSFDDDDDEGETVDNMLGKEIRKKKGFKKRGKN
jgi:ATP-dependent RNA helicase DDX47/RRP3